VRWASPCDTGSVREWWLDEQAHAGREHLDASYVAGYAAKAGYDPAADVEVLKTAGLSLDSTVVDLGAGTGVFACAIAAECRHVVAVDVSHVMTAELGRRVEGLGLANVTVIEGGFLSYEHQGDPVDVVFTRNALHHLPDFWKAIALDRIASILRPGGILRLHDLIFDFAPADAETQVVAWIGGAVPEPSRGFTQEELAEHVRDEFSTYSWLLESMLDRTGFEVTERTFRRSVYGAYTCVRRET